MEWLYDMIGPLTIPKTIMIVICMGVVILTLVSILINFIDWIVKVYTYTKMGWFQFSYPDFSYKIRHIKYDIYIVGYPSGEIFYVDKKKLNRLKRKELVHWSHEVGTYVFADEDVEEVKKSIRPIMVYESRRFDYA